MFLFQKVKELQVYLHWLRRQKQTIGFVPTMGALHEGHLALIRQALQQHSHVVCSIFVNPTQFNNIEDLDKYPRTPHKDLEMLTKVGCHALFLPSENEIYPPGAPIRRDFLLGRLDQVMEGAFRPGHFAGVAQVVNRLLEIIQPNALYMGQKDYQQVMVVQEILRQTNSKVELVMCPTVREADGLAMSSRNARLDPALRRRAGIIYQTLLQARDMARQHYSIRDIQKTAIQQLSAPGFRPEYFEIVNSETLMPLERLNFGTRAIACVAVWAGNVRLIDNMFLS